MKLSSFWREAYVWNRPDWITVALFAAVMNLLLLAPTLYMLQLYDRVMVSGSVLTLGAVSAVTLFLFAVLALADWFRSRMLIRIGLSIDARLSAAVFRAACARRLQGSEAAASESLGDLTLVRQFLTGPTFVALLDVPWVPLYVGVLFLLHPVLGLSAIAFAAIQLGLTYAAHRGTSGAVEASQQASRGADEAAAQLLRAGEVLSAMGMGPRALQLWHGRQRAAMHADAGLAERQARWSSCSKWLRYTQQSAALGVGAWLVIRGELTVGAMIAGNVLTTRALSPLDAWAQTWGAALAARKALARLQALLAGGRQPPASPLSVTAEHSEKVVRLQAVDVSFPGRPHPVLEQVDLELRAGQVTVLQGPSGSGKTTLARVVLGIATPTSGRVQWALGRRDAGDALGYLPQTVDLFQGSVAENIARFGAADSGQVIEAARLAGVHEPIQHMPMGYDTPVGASGAFLSGGLRQRLGLARAVYGRPDLVVLDEPNSHLDAQGEAALHAALLHLKQRGCAVLVISHRPAVQEVADQIRVLQRGRLTSRPTPRTAPLIALAA